MRKVAREAERERKERERRKRVTKKVKEVEKGSRKQHMRKLYSYWPSHHS